MKTMRIYILVIITGISFTLQAQLVANNDYTGGSGDFTNVINPQLKMQSPGSYIRVAHLSAHSTISSVYNFEAGKNAYWGEDGDGGTYFFRGRDFNISKNLWVAGGATISSD